MKKISTWAKNNKWFARILVIICHILLNVIGIITGILLNDLAINIPAFALPLFIIVLLIGMIFYPKKSEMSNQTSRNLFYIRRKRWDFMLAASTFLVILYMGNHFDNPLKNYPGIYAAASSLPGDSTVKSYKKIGEFSASLKDNDGKLLKWKERKKIMKEQLKGIKNAGDLSKGEKVALTIVSILVALGLLYVVAGLACGLACNGADAAAWLVLIGGTAVVALLLVIAMRAIHSNRKARRKLEGLPPEN